MNSYRMYTIVLVIFLCNLAGFSNLLAQVPSPYHYRVSYDMFLDFDGYQVYKADLFAGTTRSLFWYQVAGPAMQSGLMQTESDPGDFRFDLVDTARFFILSDRSQNRILQLERMPATTQFCVVTEPFGQIEWQITGRKKTMDSFECEEATAHFQGREYVVWFSEQIPISFGPWKFHGLPGLVFEAYDTTGEVRFNLRSIKKIGTQTGIPVPRLSSYPTMDRTAYIAHFRSYVDGLERRMMSRFDRSFQVKVRSSTIRSVEMYDE